MVSSTSTESGSTHGLAVREVARRLRTDPVLGLSSDEAARRLRDHGPNVLPHVGGTGPVLRILRQVNHPLVYVLLVAGAAALATGAPVDAGVIFGVVLVNAAIGFVQESRAEAALDELRALVRTIARVVRAGEEGVVASEELVPGDLVRVEAGDKVPADLRLVHSAELRVDESALTGESLPVAKDEAVLPAATPAADRLNIVYSGTLVTGGLGAGVAVATGASTELGEIHRLVGAAEPLATPLTRELARFSRLLTVVILVLAAATFAVGVARGESAPDMLTAAVALAVGAIPEGLPAAVTITLAIGVARMARRHAVVRRLPAVETLGSTTVICSDKTGTLTENQMTVREVWTPSARFTVTGSGYAHDGQVLDPAGAVADVAPGGALYQCLLAGAACNDAALTTADDGRPTLVGDPTEGAMLVVARKAGLDPAAMAARWPRMATLPFSSQRSAMATVHRDATTGEPVAFVKGAVERVVLLCCNETDPDGASRPVDAEAVLRAAEDLARGGLRVIATAVRRGRDLPLDPGRLAEAVAAGGFTFAGLQAMLDPPRPAAVAAVRSCRAAGIAVTMVTGDHVATATAVAGQVGLLDGPVPDGDPRLLTGADVAALAPQALADAVEKGAVLARVSPEQKLRLVEALQARRHVVAMTGDGVNDAPALRQADVGVAMGHVGTEVAKDAADVVLLDDDFATIEAAVEEGRGVFDNLTKFIAWTLPTNAAEGMVILVAVLLGTALPILPVQILWINMTTAVALGLMLAFEPKEPGIMQRPPRPPGRPLLTRALGVRILVVSAVLVAGSSWLFGWELSRGSTPDQARTTAVNLFVAVEIVYLFGCRSLTRSSWQLGVLSNRWVVGGVAVQVLAQLAITYLPVMHQVFHTAAIDAQAWGRIAAFALLTAAVVAVDKRVRARQRPAVSGGTAPARPARRGRSRGPREPSRRARARSTPVPSRRGGH